MHASGQVLGLLVCWHCKDHGCFFVPSAVRVLTGSSWVTGLELAVGFGVSVAELECSSHTWLALEVVLCSGWVVCTSELTMLWLHISFAAC